MQTCLRNEVGVSFWSFICLHWIPWPRKHRVNIFNQVSKLSQIMYFVAAILKMVALTVSVQMPTLIFGSLIHWWFQKCIGLLISKDFEQKYIVNLTNSKFQSNMICSFGAILASSSAAATDNNYDNHKSHPYMSPSYAGDTKSHGNNSCTIGNKRWENGDNLRVKLCWRFATIHVALGSVKVEIFQIPKY